ncbi:MAG: polymerase sigma factor [Acidobacteria bacterium]|nr:polymerase sigma factor [Acidobacteriota bacterium]
MGPAAKNDVGPDATEAELCAHMKAYLDGEIDAFDALYAAFAGRLRGYLLSQCRDATLADDLLQETFMQIHRSRRTYQPGRPVTPWVYAIARHVYLMKRRSAGRRVRFEQGLAADARSNDFAHDALGSIVDGDQVRRALREVPADQRQALLMHHVEGWSFLEIAARLGIRVNAAKTRAFRGMRKMREHLK